MISCKNCGADLNDNDKFCYKCGSEIKSKCSNCGAELHNGSNFCSICGAAIAPSTESECHDIKSNKADEVKNNVVSCASRNEFNKGFFYLLFLNSFSSAILVIIECFHCFACELFLTTEFTLQSLACFEIGIALMTVIVYFLTMRLCIIRYFPDRLLIDTVLKIDAFIIVMYAILSFAILEEIVLIDKIIFIKQILIALSLLYISHKIYHKNNGIHGIPKSQYPSVKRRIVIGIICFTTYTLLSSYLKAVGWY